MSPVIVPERFATPGPRGSCNDNVYVTSGTVSNENVPSAAVCANRGWPVPDNSPVIPGAGVPFEKGGPLARGHAMEAEPMPSDRGPHQLAFRDEYGFRYDSDGNRLNARGYVISPHNPQR